MTIQFAILGLLPLAAIVVAAAVIIFRFIVRSRTRKSVASVPTLTEWDRKCMAYHEAGHAVCSYFLPEREPLLRITISPSDEAFGMIRTAPRLYRNETSRSLGSSIAVLLAGRLAEEMFLGGTTTSCIYDLETAKHLACDMVTKFGMGKIYGVSIPPVEVDRCGLVAWEIVNILQDGEALARKTLENHAETVTELAKKLLAQSTLEQDEISSFFQMGVRK